MQKPTNGKPQLQVGCISTVQKSLTKNPQIVENIIGKSKNSLSGISLKIQTTLLFIFLAVAGFGQTSSDGLVLHLPFSGNANDASGNELNGTVKGAVLAPDRQGNLNSAYYVGKDASVSVAENDLLNIDPDGFTFSIWAKGDGSDGKNSDLAKVATLGESGQGGYAIRYTEGFSQFSTYLYSNTGVSSSFTVDEQYFDANVWNMYTITYGNGVFKTYLNGVLVHAATTTSYPSIGYDLTLGDGPGLFDAFKGWIDEVKIYNRALTDIEVANLSGLSGAIKATELNAFTLSDFELGALNPVKASAYWDVWGSVNDEDSYIDVAENPIKVGANTSDFVGRAVAFKSGIEWNDFASKREYVVTSGFSGSGNAYDHHHVMQWKYLVPDSTIIKVDTFFLDWMIINQIHQGYEYYDGGTCEKGGSIAYGGGIFNDNTKVLGSANPLEYEFRYRANPDAAKVPYTIDIGKWMTFTYEIFWTKSDTGYYRLWKDGELLGSAHNVQTVADCGTEADDFLQFKVGQYNKWDDSEIDSITVYFDDVELYIDPEVTVEDICPECFNACAGTNIEISGSVTPDTLSKGVGTIDVSVTGGTEPYMYTWNSGHRSEDIFGLTEKSYTITVTDNNGCRANTSFNITNHTEALNLNGNYQEDNVNVYPNPAENIVYVSNANESFIQVVNILGEVILEKYSNENITPIDCNFTPGLYIINIVKDNTLLFSKKLIVR